MAIPSNFSSVRALLLYCCCCSVNAESGPDPVLTAWHDGHIVTIDKVMLAEFKGGPEEAGAQAGHLLAAQVMRLVRGVRPLNADDTPREVRLVSDIPSPYRRELDALACAASVDPEALLHANIIVDTMCSALVRLGDENNHQPLLLGRNLDFSGTDLLGDTTVVTIMRATGKHVVASIGWPGYTGVLSGMNDDGISICVLLNLHHTGSRPASGTPIGYRVRAILEDSATFDGAIMQFAASAVASDNFGVIADSKHATLVWQEEGKLKRVDPKEGWLFCTNSLPDAQQGGPEDARGKCMRGLAATATNVDAVWVRSVLGAVYLTGLNAQAMVLMPEERRLQLATGHSVGPAALSEWHEIELAPLLSGGSIDATVVKNLGKVVEPLRHYDHQ